MAENELDQSAYVTWFDRRKQCGVGFALTATGDGRCTLGRQLTQERNEWRSKISMAQCVINEHHMADGILTWVLRSIGLNLTLVLIP